MNDLAIGRPRRLTVASLVAVLLVVPASVFFAALVGTRLQPIEHEPAHTLGRILDAFAALPIPTVAVLLLVLPAVALILSAMVLQTSWRSDAIVRQDVATLLSATRRMLIHPAFVLSALSLLVALAVLGMVIGHLITD
jgi:hypothetical protein